MSKTDIIGGDNLGGATHKMTTKDKLSIIVQAGIDGGWKDKDTEYGINKSEIFGFLIEFNDCVMSIPDLISDRAFMLAVYGEGLMCEDKPCPLKFSRCDNCVASVFNPEPAYIYHSQHAIKLLLTSTPDAAIEYLYKEMNDE